MDQAGSYEAYYWSKCLRSNYILRVIGYFRPGMKADVLPGTLPDQDRPGISQLSVITT